ncbi:MAG: hypothetical protein H6905_06885 [Hyphomicrobiales bacterium]|nr:hypothetical protein [Hyphomicrobiales bacterium]
MPHYTMENFSEKFARALADYPLREVLDEWFAKVSMDVAVTAGLSSRPNGWRDMIEDEIARIMTGANG